MVGGGLANEYTRFSVEDEDEEERKGNIRTVANENLAYFFHKRFDPDPRLT